MWAEADAQSRMPYPSGTCLWPEWSRGLSTDRQLCSQGSAPRPTGRVRHWLPGGRPRRQGGHAWQGAPPLPPPTPPPALVCSMRYLNGRLPRRQVRSPGIVRRRRQCCNAPRPRSAQVWRAHHDLDLAPASVRLFPTRCGRPAGRCDSIQWPHCPVRLFPTRCGPAAPPGRLAQAAPAASRRYRQFILRPQPAARQSRAAGESGGAQGGSRGPAASRAGRHGAYAPRSVAPCPPRRTPQSRRESSSPGAWHG